MRTTLNAKMLHAASLAAALLAFAGTASALTTVNLTAQRTTAALPDGTVVPMWSYCGAAVAPATGVSGTTVGGACPAAGTAPVAWTPGPTIVVPAGDSLTINLSNTLPVPTSLTIVGQFGGTDLGTPNKVASPTHAPQTQTTWNTNATATFTPPVQAMRARSFGPEAAALTGTQSYTWAAGILRPGTYIYETGSHPSLQVPMGLYGVVIVTTAPTTTTSTATPPVTTVTAAGQAYPGAVTPSTLPPGSNAYGVPYAGVAYDADATFLLSEIDAAQNIAVDAAATAGTAEDLVSSDASCVQAQKGGVTPCYPPAVNYRPTYYLVNGSPFNAANPAATAAVVADYAKTGNVLLRFANAGLRTHVPTIPGLQMAVVSEDGNLAPGLPKVQSEVNLVPGRTADVLIQPASNGVTGTAPTAPTAYSDAAYSIFDRALALASGNLPNAGLYGFLAVAPAGTGASSSSINSFLGTATGGIAAATPSAANYNFTVAPNVLMAFTGSVATKSVGIGTPTTGTPYPLYGNVTWNADGTFTYMPSTGGAIVATDSFAYCSSANLTLCGTVTLTVASETATIVSPSTAPAFTSTVSTLFRALTRSNGVLASFAASDGYPLAVTPGTIAGKAAVTTAAVTKGIACTVLLNADGSFSAVPSGRAGGTCNFAFTVTDPRNPASTTRATASVTFPAPSGLNVTVADALNGSTGAVAPVTDYMWIIEEDQTFHNANPGVTPAFTPKTIPPQTLATSFHRSHMPVVAVGCTGPLSCGDGSGGQTIQALPAPIATYTSPADVALAPSKYYFISVLPGDAANPFVNGFGLSPTSAPGTTNPCLVGNGKGTAVTAPTDCGHSLGGSQIAAGQTAVTVTVEPNPLPPAALTVYIFEDNSPTNNDYDANEVGLGGFEIIVNDVAGRSGDPVGQITYDAYNMPLTNTLLGVRGCPNETPAGTAALQQTNLVGVVYSCPDGDRPISSVSVGTSLITVTTSVPHQFGASVQVGPNPVIDISGLGVVALNGSFPITVTSPNSFTFATPAGVSTGAIPVYGISMARDATTYQLAGQALINNIMPGRYDVLAHPGAAREGAGEQWYQTSTLEGTLAQDAFTKAGEPNFFQEFGPPGFHTFTGYINPAHLADQNAIALAQAKAAGVTGTTIISGRITSLHMSRTIMETLWDAGSNAAIAQSNCFVALNQNGETGNDIAFAACNADGTFTLPAVPADQLYELVIWDQWLDQIIAFKNLPANTVNAGSMNLGNIPVFSWFTRVEASMYLDVNGNGVRDPGEPGIAEVPVTIHFRDGSISNILTTDGNGSAVFNELFPLFNWYVIESDKTRYASTGVNITVDAGGLTDCETYAGGQGTINMGASRCPTATMSNTGALDASANLGTRTAGILNSQYVWTDPTTGLTYGGVPAGASKSTNRVDPGTTPYNGMYEGLQTFINQTQIFDWGRRNFNVGENGGISGMVVYASTRGFDDPSLEVQFLWEPGVPRVQINLYREQANADGTTGYILVNTTTTTSWDDWAATDANGMTINMKCPGQDPNDPFLSYSLGTANQFKCYDGFHLWNQVQPAVFDGAYLITTDSSGKALAPGKYVVEMVPPAGYEIVKEEDKNILIGDQWITPPAQQFATMSNIFIIPDQASLASALNPNNPNGNNPTQSLGFTGSKTTLPTCVGQLHQVPDFMSLFPISGQVAPFAGAMKPLCDRKEVVLNDQMMAQANFFVFTNTPRASHYTGLILDDAAAEINYAAPDFGEKFAASFVPVSNRDLNGVEISRVYADQWGTYNGLAPSTWQVNVPNPAGYSPNMLVNCMNDPGPILDTNKASKTYGKMIVDPLFNPSYSNFCYTDPFMPGMTVYLDTPVLPVAAFAAGYNPPDCALPASTPAILRVDGAGIGPWVNAAGGSITITALGDVSVPNPNYQGPSGTVAPWNARTITRHYGFGATKGIGSVALNGKPLTTTSWSDTTIVATIPAGATTGELSIVGASGQKSVDTVTVTVLKAGEATPKIVEPATGASLASAAAHPIQDAIDAATPGDLIVVDAGGYPELVIMWKPVRLQGVGAASVVISAAKYPTQKLQTWRPMINKYFGVDTVAGNQVANPQVDPLPNQEITGGIVLLEPSVLATEEGAGITVLAKNPNAVDGNGKPVANCGNTATSSYPDQVMFPPTSNTVTTTNSTNKMSDSNFTCAPSRIDGLSVTGSDAGGGIYVNGWAHGLEIANNRVYGNAGSYNGGIRVGVPYLQGLTAAPVAADGTVFAFDVGVAIHHNLITNNGTVEANPGTINAANTTGAGGGLSICTGTDNYVVNYNFICGNYSSGDGGGIGHTGVSNNGLIAQNTVIFNQSYQQTAQVNGGGIVVEGELGTVWGSSLGTGNLTIDRNVIRGNFAQGGHGGGIRLQQVNGADIAANPNKPAAWYQVTITNNMIDNNVSGWAGGGISAADALNVVVENNTVAYNDSMGIVGTMIGTDPLGRRKPLSNTTGYPSPAGISVDHTSATLLTGLSPALAAANQYANLTLVNDIVWKNRSFYFALTPQAVGPSGAVISANTLCPSNAVSDAYSLKCAPLPAQATIGQCVGTPAYWDLGTTDDASAAAVNGALNPTYTVLTSTAGYAGTGNSANDPQFAQAYCNGARANPAFIFEPGQPYLDPAAQNLTSGATLDEAGNFVDVRFGPLYLFDPLTSTSTSPGAPTGDYSLAGPAGGAFNTGAAIAGGPATLALDIYGTARPQNRGAGTGVDIGADEIPTPTPAASFSNALTFGSVELGVAKTLNLTVQNTGSLAIPFTAANFAITGGAGFTIATATNACLTASPLGVGASCVLTVSFDPTVQGTAAATLKITSGVTTLGSVALSGQGVSPHSQLTGVTYFGSVLAGSSSVVHTIVYTNPGVGPITYTGYVLNPATNYTVTGTTCSTTQALAPNASCKLSVTFTPTVGGPLASNLQVSASEAGNTTTAQIGLTGVGDAPALAFQFLNNSSYAFTTAGTHSFILKNTGLAPLTIGSLGPVIKTSPGGGSFTINVAGTSCKSGGTLNAAATSPLTSTCTVSVTFTGTTTTTGSVSVSGVQSGAGAPTTVYSATVALTGK